MSVGDACRGQWRVADTNTVTLNWMLPQAAAMVALVLLVPSGVAKIINPDPTAGALGTARLPSARIMVRGLGAIEVVSSLVALAAGAIWLLPATILYISFALFTGAAVLGRFPLQSCGCFGRDETPPTGIHVVFNLLAAGSLSYLWASGLPMLSDKLSTAESVGFLAFAIIGAYLSYVLLSELPNTQEQMRGQ